MLVAPDFLAFSPTDTLPKRRWGSPKPPQG